ncbi:MAG: CRISPR-associated endonuclease Cas2 [Desulfobulbus sp.]|nr:CRISPR-associated endonuclease Cas2 [Desulfobulbus sp.]
MSGFFAICFDVREPKRLRRVADTLENFGVRVQRSLFECFLNAEELVELQGRIARIIDVKQDHVRYYPLCPKDVHKVRVDGAGRKTVDVDYYLL